MQIDQDTLRRKHDDLVQALREKSRKHLQTQELYDKLKRRAMLGQVQNAASDAVDHTIQASATANRYVDRLDEQNQRPQAPVFSNQQSDALHIQANTDAGGNMGPPNFRGGNGEIGWAGFSSQESIQRKFVQSDKACRNAKSTSDNQPVQTPSTHRQRLAPGNQPTPRLGPAHAQFNGAIGTPMLQKRASPRQPLANLGTNAGNSGLAGYGMSAGMKVSNLSANGAPRPAVRSRGTFSSGLNLMDV